MESLIGHDTIWAYLTKARHNGALHHAYLLVGPKGVGKETVARFFSAELLGVTPKALVSHPDVTVVTRGVDEKTGKTKKYISIDDIRGLLMRLTEASFLGGYRVAIIDGAEDMSTGAANAFLKTLEEPKGQTLLWLLVEDESKVPLTIRSRCQTISFSRVREEEIEQTLVNRGIVSNEAARVAHSSLGRPGCALRALESPEEIPVFVTEAERFASLFGKSFHDKLVSVEELFGDKTDHLAARETLVERLGVWQIALTDLCREVRGLRPRLVSSEKKVAMTNDEAVKIDTAIRYAKQYIEANVHPRLLIEHILQTIP